MVPRENTILWGTKFVLCGYCLKKVCQLCYFNDMKVSIQNSQTGFTQNKLNNGIRKYFNLF